MYENCYTSNITGFTFSKMNIRSSILMLLLLLTGFPTGKCHHGNTGGISVCYKRVLWQVIYENYRVYRKGIFSFSQVTHMVATLAISTPFTVIPLGMGMATLILGCPHGSPNGRRLGYVVFQEWYFSWKCNAVFLSSSSIPVSWPY